MLSPRRVLVGLCLLAGLLVVTALSSAQDSKDGKGEKVKFDTVDGVSLHGLFFAGAKRNSPTVLMLHGLGEDPRKKDWISLAETLNREGYAVLAFDFRGHGPTGTSIEPAVFWKYPRNMASVKGGPKKESIEYKDMKSDYYPVLVNDIAAAKAFLDNRNDAGSCNTSSLILLGADTGATLGAIWLNAEWRRFVFTPPNPMLGVFQATFSKTPEGKDTIACIWLSATSKLGSRTISLPKLLETPAKENATPMVFMYSEEDSTGKTVALACAKAIKGTKKDEKKYAFTAAVPIKGGGKLTGAGLLKKSLGTDEAIVQYIKDVAEAKGNEWGEREFRKTQYVWRIPGIVQPIPARLPMERTLVFDTYERFLPR